MKTATAFILFLDHSRRPNKLKTSFVVIPIMQEEKTKTKYNDNELGEFRELITGKIAAARAELYVLAGSLSAANTNGDEAAIAGKTLEDGSATFEKEQTNQLAARQKKFIEQLEAALLRIENKTYGICRSTGKLIPKERLRAVPHTTQSMEAKLKQS
jgi:DnaK suppressor protein